jgi:N-acetylated-alpha-linked acidic dipeptidase
MFRRSAAFLCCAILLPAQPQAVYRGYSADSSHAEHEAEEKFRDIPSPANMRAYMERLAARPHHVGSAYDKANAEWILSKFKEWGWDARIEQFDVLFPTPKNRALELISPTSFKASLAEPTVPSDPTSGQGDEQLPTYNAYSADGDVTAPLVYVNHGVPADYEELDRRGISVKGAIVISRYGGSWRGIKPKVAAEHGALGCLIYSDPKDDGYAEGSVFPEGAWRPPLGVQRGSVADMPLYPGDPLTPGVGATKDAKRLPLSEAQTITKIPVLPISYADAKPLLKAMEGPVAPEAWRGGLDITYHLGAGPAKVHMVMKSNWDTKPLYDVIARMPGSEFPDEWVIRGNHHDAWVNGAEDPISGTIAEMEEARAFGELSKQGWRPKRTLIYTVWDGEEPGLLGSTEWVETHAEELSKKAVAYINSDGNGRGYLGMGGSHSLERFINDVAKDIDDPEKHISVWKRNQLARISREKGDDRSETRKRKDLRIEALGSGSDFTPFLQHLGIPSLNLGFGGEDGGGIYHSIYDDIYWYQHFSDKDYVYGRALAQTAGTAMMRLADASIVPFEFGDVADTVKKYSGEVKTLWQTKHDEIEEQNRQLDDGVFSATADPTKVSVPPAKEMLPPHLNFAPLEDAVDHLSRGAEAYEKALTAHEQNAPAKELNPLLIQAERTLLDSGGLPKRPWFQHMIYAPGFYTGYGVKTLPAIREAIEEKEWDSAPKQIVRTAAAIEREAALLDQMTALLK